MTHHELLEIVEAAEMELKAHVGLTPNALTFLADAIRDRLGRDEQETA